MIHFSIVRVGASSRAENWKTFALGCVSEITVQGYKLQISGIAFSGHQSRAELKCVGGPQRVRFNKPLGMAADKLNSGYLRPPVPRTDYVSTRCGKHWVGLGILAAAASDGRKKLDAS